MRTKNLDTNEVKKKIDQWSDLSEFSIDILKAFFKKRFPKIERSSMRLKIFDRLQTGLKGKWQRQH